MQALLVTVPQGRAARCEGGPRHWVTRSVREGSEGIFGHPLAWSYKEGKKAVGPLPGSSVCSSWQGMPGSSWWCNQIQQCPKVWALHAVPLLKTIILTGGFLSSQSATVKG